MLIIFQYDGGLNGPNEEEEDELDDDEEEGQDLSEGENDDGDVY